MNPGIYYLYEYKNNHCMRNTGFLKLTKKPDCWLLQIQARNIPVTNQHLVPLCAILTEQEHNISQKIYIFDISNEADVFSLGQLFLYV